MADNIGLDSYVSIETEVTYGTDPDSSPTFARIVSESITRKSDQTGGCRGLGRAMPAAIRNFRRRSSGDLTFHAEYEGMEKFLLHFLGGTDAFTDNLDSTFDHKFSPNGTTRLLGASIHVNKDTERDVFPGSKLSSLRMGINEENLEFVLSQIGLVGTHDATPDTPTYPAAPCVVPIEKTNGLVTKVDSVARTFKGADLTLAWL